MPELLKRIQSLLWQQKKLNKKCSILYLESESDFLKNGNFKLEYIVQKKTKREIKLEKQRLYRAKLRVEDRDEVLRKQREYYHKNREAQLKKILENRKLNKLKKQNANKQNKL